MMIMFVWWKKQTFFSSVIFILIIILSLPSFFNVIFKASMIPAPNSFTKRLIAWLFVDQDQYLSIFKGRWLWFSLLISNWKLKKYGRRRVLSWKLPPPSPCPNHPPRQIFNCFQIFIFQQNWPIYLFIVISRTLQKKPIYFDLMFSLFTMITIEYRIDHNQQTAAYLPAQLVQAHSHHEGHWLHCQAQADHVRVLYWKKRCIMFSSFVPFCMAGQVECTAWLL